MKKFILSAMAMFAMTAAINAQSLVFEIDGVEYESGSTFTYEKKFLQEDMGYKKNAEIAMKLKNVSSTPITFKFKNAGDLINAPEGYERNFQICTDMCYMGDDIPEFTIEANSYLMAYGVTAPASLHINNLDGILGDVEVRYEVSNVNDPSDVYTFNVVCKFIDKAAIYDAEVINNMFISQNGNGKVTFNYNFKDAARRYLNIVNVTGQVVARYEISDMEGAFEVPATLGKGMYIYSIEQNGKKVAAHKFIVK